MAKMRCVQILNPEGVLNSSSLIFPSLVPEL
jgi:hypothetical protein